MEMLSRSCHLIQVQRSAGCIRVHVAGSVSVVELKALADSNQRRIDVAIDVNLFTDNTIVI